jgi:hypothetical protein
MNKCHPGNSRFHIIYQPHKCSTHAALPQFPYILSTIASYLACRSHQTTYPLNPQPLSTQSLHLRLHKSPVLEMTTYAFKPSFFKQAGQKTRLPFSSISLSDRFTMLYIIDLHLKSLVQADDHYLALPRGNS